MKILLGVTGSVGAILTPKIVQAIQEEGHEVTVICTQSARQAFFHKEDLIALGAKVFFEEDEWAWGEEGRLKWHKNNPVLHIKLRQDHSAFVIAPCSANTLAKLANGLCDNLLTCVARAWKIQERPMIIAPAMNGDMWRHPITAQHLTKVGCFSSLVSVVPPTTKMLACGDYDIGALANIQDIVATLEASLSWKFPLADQECSGLPCSPHPGAFAAQRRSTQHTGVDLYTDVGSEVYAVEAGRVVAIEGFTGASVQSPWWEETKCILVEGKSGVICYGEVEPLNWVAVNRQVYQRQILATVKRVIQKGKDHYEIPGWSPSMLHMEVYPHGTKVPSDGFNFGEGLLDPTPMLLKCKPENVPVVNYEWPQTK